MQLKSII